MPELCTRSIKFTISDKSGGPGVEVYAFEQNGNLVFTVDALDTPNKSADLRGLFFHINESVIPGLTITNMDSIITGTQIAKNAVMDLGNGANMNGIVKDGFDIGIKFGTPGIGKDKVDGPVSFTLDGSGALTLDDIAYMQFGARTTSVGAKLTGIAPAAPDAVADSYTIFEDGQSGLTDPSTVPEGVLFSVLANDTDADGDTLTITDVHGALHGTTQIVDGADADTLPGDAILYTPFEDYSGSDSFTYCISDNAGGTDFADSNVSITAVADVPALSYEIIAGAQVNQIIVKVTATQTDADGSEFMDRIELSGIPDGVTVDFDGYDPTSEPGQIVKEFLLTLPMDQDTNFNLDITAFSKETSNGDQESTFVTVPIVLETNEISANRTFQATDQSIWTTGAAFTFDDERFLGIDVGDSGGDGGLITTDWAYAVKAGFQSDLHFEGGDIDAAIPYQFDFDTFYNKTTDVLVIDTNAMILDGGSFETIGPSLQYKLDFIFNYLLHLDVDLVVDLGVDSFEEDLFSINSSNNYSANIVDYDSVTSPPIGFTLPDPLGSISVELAWPNLVVTGAETSSGIYEGNGASNNALQLDLDIDQALADIFFGGVNPFDLSVDLGIAGATLEILDADVLAGLNFLQDFLLDAGTVAATLNWEDGSTSSFTFGDELYFSDASDIDAGGDADGVVEFTLDLDLVGSTLKNDTDLGFNVGWNFDLFKGTWWYNVAVASDSGSWGPLVDLGQNIIPVAAIDVFNNTVGVDFVGVNPVEIYA